MRPAALSMLLLCACGSSASPDAAPEEDDAGADACVPATCDDFSCGAIDDGCGGALHCGGCADGLTCGASEPGRCGGECESDLDCEGELHCDALTTRCTAGCRLGAELLLPLPVHPVELTITLDGAPLPEVDEHQRPSLLLSNVEGPQGEGLLGLEVPLFDEGAPRHTQTLNLPPGDYRVGLQNDPGTHRPDPRLPFGYYSEVARIRVEPDTRAVSVDLRTAELTVRPRLDGGPWPTGTEATFSVGLWPRSVEDVSSGEVLESVSWRLPLGTHEVLLDASRPRAGRQTVLSVELTEDTTVTLDVPTVELTFEVTFDGDPPASPVGLTLEPVDQEGETRLRAEFGDPLVATVVPGRYAVRYTGDDALASLEQPPLTTLDLDTDGVVRLDVPRVQATLRVVPAGNLTPRECAAPASIYFAGHEIPLDSPASTVERTLWLRPGQHELRFHGPSSPTCDDGRDHGWPAGDFTLPPFEVSSDGTVDVELTRWRLEANVTLGGAPLPAVASLRAEDNLPPSLVLYRDGFPPEVELPLYPAPLEVGAVDSGRVALWVVEGTYELTYRRPLGDLRSEWPRFSAHLRELAITGDTELDLDIPRARVRIDARLDGPLRGFAEPPWPSIETGSGGPALLMYERSFDRVYDARRQDLGFAELWARDGELQAPIEGWIVPGTYSLELARRPGWFVTGPYWPRSGLPPVGTPLGCWTVPE